MTTLKLIGCKVFQWRQDLISRIGQSDMTGILIAMLVVSWQQKTAWRDYNGLDIRAKKTSGRLSGYLLFINGLLKFIV